MMKRYMQAPLKITLFAALLAGLGSISSCGKKCRDLEGSISGQISSLYDFKECFPNATFDSTLVISSDTAFKSYKQSHMPNCKASLDSIDFSKHMLLGFKTITHAC